MRDARFFSDISEKADAMRFREITDKDVPELFVVRSSTDENNLSVLDLYNMGVTEEICVDKLHGTYKGWLCEIEKRIVGFSIGDCSTGEMWVIAVMPSYIGQGIGSKLLYLVEDWLYKKGCNELWLSTDIDTKLRAYSFYKKHGWVDSEIKDGLRFMTKTKPGKLYSPK